MNVKEKGKEVEIKKPIPCYHIWVITQIDLGYCQPTTNLPFYNKSE